MKQENSSTKFSLLYERWRAASGKSRLTLEKQLLLLYGEAWSLGDLEDRDAVLFFIFLRRDSAGFPIIVEALNSPQVEVASQGAAIAAVLIREDYDLGDEIEGALVDFGQRFPHWESISYFALQDLRRKKSGRPKD